MEGGRRLYTGASLDHKNDAMTVTRDMHKAKDVNKVSDH